MNDVEGLGSSFSRIQLPAGNVPHAVVTFAAKACVALTPSDTDAGTIATLRTRSGATLTVIDAVFAASACAWAVITQLPEPRTDVL